MVVELYLEKFFDKVNHDVLMARMKRKLSDKRQLYYIRQMLKAGLIDERAIREEREKGTSQGGPISPLRINVLLDDFDKEMERLGHKFCRYADDCIIMVRTIAAARRVLVSVTLCLEAQSQPGEKQNRQRERTPLPRLHHSKGKSITSRLGKGGEIQGANLRNNPPKPKPRIGATIAELNAYIRGWGNYYKLAALKDKVAEQDGWIRRKLRLIKLKQCKRVYAIDCFLRNNGGREAQAFIVAGSGKGISFIAERCL